MSPWTPDLSIEFEYAAERNAEALNANAYTFQGAYELSTLSWKPRLSYRYAHFDGDNPSTSPSEAFDSLLPGFYDWGTWWQGEIAGEVLHPELESRLADDPRARDTVRCAGRRRDLLQVHAARAGLYAPGVTDSHLAYEMDAYADWKINENFTATFVGAFADPGRAVEQSINRTKNFIYGMAFLAYSY